MSVLTKNQEIYAHTLAQKTGLDLNVVRGWVLAEESFTAAQSRDKSGNQNWLNYSAGTGPGGRFDHPEWNNNPVKAATDTANHILNSDYYAGIRATFNKHPADQIQAIADSPWSADHYGGGSHLTSTYHLVSGLPAPKLTDTTPDTPTDPKTPTAPKVTKTPKTIVPAAPEPQTAPTVVTPAVYLKGSKLALPDDSGDLPSTPTGPLSGTHLKGSKIALPALSITPPVPSPLAAVDVAVSVLKKPTSTVNDSIVETARSQIGVKYVWGAESKGVAFDCSGLVQWAAAQHGIKVPRVTTDQVKSGTAVNPKQSALKPGDLLFFGPDFHHVAIYSGDGKMIEAPHKNANVREVPLRTADLTAARRL